MHRTEISIKWDRNRNRKGTKMKEWEKMENTEKKRERERKNRSDFVVEMVKGYFSSIFFPSSFIQKCKILNWIRAETKSTELFIISDNTRFRCDEKWFSIWSFDIQTHTPVHSQTQSNIVQLLSILISIQLLCKFFFSVLFWYELKITAPRQTTIVFLALIIMKCLLASERASAYRMQNPYQNVSRCNVVVTAFSSIQIQISSIDKHWI